MDRAETTEGAARKPGLIAKRVILAALGVGLIAIAVDAIGAAQSPDPQASAGQIAAPANAGAAAEPATITPKGIPDEATIDRYMAIGQARYGASFMSPADARDPDMRRLATYYLMVDEETDRRKAAAGGGRRGAAVKLSFVDVKAFLGEAAYADEEALAAKAKTGGRRN